LFKLADEVLQRLEVEVRQLDTLMMRYAELLRRVQRQEPDLVELTALASVLHSFYNGLENIFLAIAKGLDEHVPEGGRWHRDLLEQMTSETPRRPALLSTSLAQRLREYLAFRHFYRHAYVFFLEWPALEMLVRSLPEVWREARGEIDVFLRGEDYGE
jgi:hypothetical protein